ncbi:MAG: hypothetical protein WAL61_10360 [Acidimicrobiales bacterium]
MTIAVPTGEWGLLPRSPTPRRSRRTRVKRIVIASGSALIAFLLIAGSWVGLSLYRIDHAVHHVGVPASLLAKGKNDLLAIVKGPDHSEQVFVFHDAGGHTNVLQIPEALGLPLADGGTVPLGSLSLHAPTAIIAGLDRLGIPVTHYVGVDLHMVNPHSSLGQLATGTKSMTSMISDPTGTSSLLEQVASHIFLGPGTPVSAVLSLMNVPTAHPVSVPVERDVHGVVVLTAAFAHVLRAFL